MELQEIIKDRRSIQLYQDKEVDIVLLKSLLETAIWVPNHKMTQPWRFVFVYGEGKEKIAQLNKSFSAKGATKEEKERSGEKAFQKMMDVPVFLMVIMEENADRKQREEDYAATSCFIQNFSLLAWEKGIGMIWKTGPLTTTPAFREAIGAKLGEKVVGMLQIGYPAKVPKPRKRVDIHDRIEEINSAPLY
ncbi:Putative NAD(P)H nitroreductase YdjA [Paraliobacillus sp. PM-2]|uniref:nitroreductase family protein n=1 Tax=Paraliobacillus sp. PM-2 TaxID=1462524 RepID=UPI00061CBADB|nr:nitroreductase [Paraliobacillus sp. PM-2]CQR46066.1 Putative NAD(P)H nitroreductase YdjA [Paraliobacillus sp. PM-2]